VLCMYCWGGCTIVVPKHNLDKVRDSVSDPDSDWIQFYCGSPIWIQAGKNKQKIRKSDESLEELDVLSKGWVFLP